MPAKDLPLAFGELLVGAIVADAGVKKVQQAFADSSFSGGTSGPGGTGSAPGGVQPLTGKHVNPFAHASGVVAERIDQGQDFRMNPGSPIVAPFDSQYMGTIPDWYAGQPYIAFKILSGPYKGRIYYLAEQINPVNFSVGQKIGAGTVIAHYASSGTGIEFGLASSDWKVTLARATSGYTEGQQTAAGQLWSKILAQLGVKVTPN